MYICHDRCSHWDFALWILYHYIDISISKSYIATTPATVMIILLVWHVMVCIFFCCATNRAHEHVYTMCMRICVLTCCNMDECSKKRAESTKISLWDYNYMCDFIISAQTTKQTHVDKIVFDIRSFAERRNWYWILLYICFDQLEHRAILSLIDILDL